ncbi:MAG: peptidylprolyl isomerase [Clostridia bacterium]|nr:peptidylprolyl isomerase [Clostridia bacterium]
MKTKVKLLIFVIFTLIFSCLLSACDANEVKVLFYDGETLIAEEKIDNKGGFTLLEPKKDAYSFQGWYLDKELNTRFETVFYEEMPSQDVAVYAKWQPVGKIVFVTNSSQRLDDIIAGYGNTIYVPSNISKTNYAFDGWYLDNNTFQQSAEEILNSTITDNHTVYAKWKFVPKVVINLADGRKIRLELFPEVAPISVANFLRLVDAGYYTNTVFHRIIDDFMIQAGLVEFSDNQLYYKPQQPNIKGEFSANGVRNDIKHTFGVLSMARATGNDTASAQFFICSGTSPHLDGKYAAFGKTIDAESDAAVADLSSFPTQTYAGMDDFPVTEDGDYAIISSIERLQD